MIKQSVEVIRAAAAEQRGFASQVISPAKIKARYLEVAADLDRAADRLAELERWQLAGVRGETEYAKTMAQQIWRKHYKDTAPNWKPFDDLQGILTQIDNMAAGLTR